MDYSLSFKGRNKRYNNDVLILILMDYSLRRSMHLITVRMVCFNPYSNGLLSE